MRPTLRAFFQSALQAQRGHEGWGTHKKRNADSLPAAGRLAGCSLHPLGMTMQGGFGMWNGSATRGVTRAQRGREGWGIHEKQNADCSSPFFADRRTSAKRNDNPGLAAAWGSCKNEQQIPHTAKGGPVRNDMGGCGARVSDSACGGLGRTKRRCDKPQSLAEEAKSRRLRERREGLRYKSKADSSSRFFVGRRTKRSSE